MPKADTFADLDALAAMGERGVLCSYGPVWSYPGAPLPHPAQANLRLPVDNVPASRVKAALAAGAWVASMTTDAGSPVEVAKAPPSGQDLTVRTPADAGTP